MSRDRHRASLVVGAALACIVAAALFGSAACGESTSAGGRGGASGTSGAGGGLATSSTASTTSSGAAGAGGAGVDAGADPIWQFYPEQVGGCNVERLENPADVRLFEWASCDGVSDCQRMVFLPPFEDVSSQPWTTAVDTPDGTKIALSLNESATNYTYVLFANSDGRLFDGFRQFIGNGSDSCGITQGMLSTSRYGFMALHEITQAQFRWAGLLASLETHEGAVFEPTWPLGDPHESALGAKRLFFHFGAGNLVSLAAADGSDPEVFAPFDFQSMQFQEHLSAAPDRVLWTRSEVVNGSVTWKIMASDGLVSPVPYLVPADGSFYDSAAYSGSYVAWLRGVNQTDINVFDTIELWASPWSADPAGLVPKKVADVPFKNMPGLWSYVAGHDRYAVNSVQDAPVYGETYVYDLGTGSHQAYTLPDGQGVAYYAGLTAHGLWVVGRPPPPSHDPPSLIVKFALP